MNRIFIQNRRVCSKLKKGKTAIASFRVDNGMVPIYNGSVLSRDIQDKVKLYYRIQVIVEAVSCIKNELAYIRESLIVVRMCMGNVSLS